MHAQKYRHPCLHEFVVLFGAEAGCQGVDEEGEFEGLLGRGEGTDFDICGGGGKGFKVGEERGEIVGLGGVVKEGGECAFCSTHF